MKRFGWFLLLVAAVPALLPAQTRKMTVAQLQDVLTGLHKAQKSDEQIANQLKQIELTEELTPSTMNSMANLVDGPLSIEQMYVLEARSCILAPPDTDLPKATPPDAVAQRAMLAKAQDYADKTYPQLPRFTATRLVARFQDGVATMQSYGGNKVRIEDGSDPLWEHSNPYARLVNTHLDTVEIDNGNEKLGGKDTTPWGRNGLVNSMLSFLPLNLLTSEGVSSGKPKFLRWETIDGHRTGVFAFGVDKKKSLYAINYCCFPDTSTFNTALFANSKGGGGFTGLSSGNLNSGPAAMPGGFGNVSYVADWNPFKAKSGYRGELFLDPDSGVVLRTILEVKFKSSAVVHYENIRVDYAPISVGGSHLYVPVRSFTVAEIVPNGDSVVSRYGIRHQYVIQDNKDFRPMDGAYQVAALLTPVGNFGELRGVKTAEPGVASLRSGTDDDEPPPGGFPALETISRPDGPLAIAASSKAIQRPPDDEIAALLAKAAESANVYWDSLPNFTCQQVTDRFAGSSGANKWEPVDRLTGRLNYFDHQEDWEFQEYERNHKRSHDSGSDPGRGLSGFGIFGNNIRGLFRPSAKPEITWFQDDVLGDRTVQIFKYRVAKENSKFSLRVSSMEVVNAGYHGMVYIDGVTGEVRRITQIADDVPKHYPIYQTLISVDYDHVSIGGQQYLLPIGAEIVLRRSHRGSLELNQIRFGDFHRYRSTSRIVSDASSSAQ
jgi:hypothetical protein